MFFYCSSPPTQPVVLPPPLCVPASQIIASPWVEPGTLVHSPPTAAYCHSSIPATVRKIFAPDAPFLTKRDAWAATFDTLLTRTTPNPSCPMHMPNPPPLRDMYPTLPRLDGEMPMSHLQEGIVELLAQVSGDKSGGHVTKDAIKVLKEGEGAAYVRDAMCRITGREVVDRVPGDKATLQRVLPRHS